MLNAMPAIDPHSWPRWLDVAVASLGTACLGMITGYAWGKSVPGARLVPLGEAGTPSSHEIRERRTRIGRREWRNDVVLASPEISRRHAIIEFRHGDFYLSNLSSTNGTYLNGTRLEPSGPSGRVRLRHADRVRFDRLEFEFLLDGQASAPQTAPAEPVIAARDPRMTVIATGVCVRHHDRAAVAACEICSAELCVECLTVVNGSTLCDEHRRAAG